MKTAIVTTILSLALLIPGLVLACDGSYVTEVTINADCDGWSACFVVEFVGDETEANLDYAVVLLGPEGDLLESFTCRVPLTRSATGDPVMTHCVDEIWEGYHDNPPFQVGIGAEVCGTETVSEIIDVDCVVAADEQSWDHIKSLYR